MKSPGNTGGIIIQLVFNGKKGISYDFCKAIPCIAEMSGGIHIPLFHAG
jgi:hypothetical protein